MKIKKGGSEADFLQALRDKQGLPGSSVPAPAVAAGSAVAEHTTRMVMHTPPSGSGISVDDLVRRANEEDSQSAATAPAPKPPPAATTPLVDGKLKLPLSVLMQSEYNSRVVRTPARIQELADDLKKQGQKSAVTVSPNPDKPGFYWVIDGQTRVLSAGMAGWSDVWVHVDTSLDVNDPRAIYSASRTLNNQEPRKDIDRGVRWAQMIDQGKMSQAELAADEGVTQGTISKMLVFTKLPESILSLVRLQPDKFPANIAFIVHRLLQETDEPTAAKLAERIAGEDLSRSDVEGISGRMSKNFKAPAGARRRSSRISHIPVKLDGREIGEFNAFTSPDGASRIVQLKAEGLTDTEVEALSAKIKAAFEELSANRDAKA